MVRDGELAADYFSPTVPEYYRLPETRALSKNHLPHESLIAELYTALELTGALGTWEIRRETDAFGLKPDAVCVYQGKIIFWEVDRGTEDYLTPKGIKGKLDRYLRMSKANPDVRLYVGFTTVSQFDRFGRLKRSDLARAKGILGLIETYQRADQFFVSTHDYTLKYAGGAAFSTCLNPMGIAISDFK